MNRIVAAFPNATTISYAECQFYRFATWLDKVVFLWYRYCIYTVTMLKKEILLLQEVQESLPPVFTKGQLLNALTQSQRRIDCSDSTASRVQKKAKKLKTTWSKTPLLALYRFSDDADWIDVLQAICYPKEDYYLTHGSALYWLGLVAQKPRHHFCTKEIASHRPVHSGEYDERVVKQVFMKQPRFSSQWMEAFNHRLYFVEKQNINRVGVVVKNITMDKDTYQFQFTDVPRTLIDAIIAPHYCGGVVNVIQAFENVDVNLQDMLKVYQSYQPFYPYWQAIGLILEKTKGKTQANQWRKLFQESLKTFYIDRNYRSDWVFNQDWAIFHPEGVL